MFFFVVVYGDSGCTNTFCISNKDSVKIGLLEEHTTYNRSSKMNYFIYTSHHTRVKQAAPGREGGGGGGVFILVVTPLLFKKALDFSHLYAKWLGT